MVATYHGNKIDRLGKMIWSQFSSEVLKNNWDRINVTIQRKNHLQNRTHPYIIKYMILSIQNTSKRKEEFTISSRMTQR